MGYICIECNTLHQVPTDNFICNSPDCPGEGLTGILIKDDIFGENTGIKHRQVPAQKKRSLKEKINLKETISKTTEKVITIGRSAENDISVADDTVSSRHAIITINHLGKISIKDLKSLNGTFVNGSPIRESRLLKSDKVFVAELPVDWLAYLEQNITIQDIIETISIGRSSINDIVIPKEDVSSLHATIILTENGKIFIRDENSMNGTYVNGHKINQKQLYPKDKIMLAKKHRLDWRSFI